MMPMKSDIFPQSHSDVQDRGVIFAKARSVSQPCQKSTRDGIVRYDARGR